MISERFWTILKKTAKKNKIGNFPTKMKEIIRAPEGRLSCGALRGALITIFGIISALGRLENKSFQNPTKMKRKIRAPSGR